LGLGHAVIADVLTDSLVRAGWEVRTLDCMSLLGPVAGKVGERVFRRLTDLPGLYDGLHFAHFRPGSRLATRIDRSATKRLVPALRRELERSPADLVISVFATGASAVAKLDPDAAPRHRVVLCTDVSVYRFWVWDPLDLYLVTSPAAAASVRRYVPRAHVAVVPPPVRPDFYLAPSQEDARRPLGIPPEAPCVLSMGGGWGLGPLEETARALAAAGVHVLAVAGHNRSLERRLRTLADAVPNLRVYGFTDRVPQLMAAADLVLTTPGATTCSEARVMGRNLVLFDVVPGHGRDNLQHELELGGADVCDPEPSRLTECVLAALDRVERPLPTVIRPRGEWDRAFTAALASIGLDAAAVPVTAPGAGGADRAGGAHAVVSTGDTPLDREPAPTVSTRRASTTARSKRRVGSANGTAAEHRPEQVPSAAAERRPPSRINDADDESERT
jgi:UDP-N-acetylglucosamine:LPS N-acetylglucosamine transferase